MKLMSWNYRGLGGTSIVSQLMASIRLYKPKIIFIYKIKQATNFMRRISRQLKCDERWAVRDLIGRR